MNVTRESIFISAIRAFCVSLCAILGILVGIFIIVLIMGLFSSPITLPTKPDVTLAPDADGNRSLLPETAPAILRIDIHGVVGQGDLAYDKVEELLLDSREDMFRNNRIKGLFLHIDTPGGFASDSEIIYRLIKSYKEKYSIPVYVFVEGLCASGGMYIACAADRIYADPESIIGSVGVRLGPVFNVSELMSKVGVSSLTITNGIDKDALNPFRPWREGEDRSIRDINDSLYSRFVDVVVEARPTMSREKLINEYGAQVYVSETAQKLGYIDVADSSYQEALADLVKAAGIDEKTKYQVVQLSVPRTFLTQFTESKFSLFTGKVTHIFPLGANMTSEMCGKFLYLYEPTQ